MTVEIPEVERWVSAEFERLAEVVQDYDPNLELRWIPPELRSSPEDKKRPYCIYDTKSRSIVMFANELDTPADILARLWGADNVKGNVLDNLRAHNAAVAALQAKERMEQLEEAQDLAAFVIGNTKTRWKHNGVTYDDEMRRIDEPRQYYH